MYYKTGISLCVPGLSVHNYDQSLGSLDIRPCLSGPFELPDGYELASPVYLLEPRKKGTTNTPFTIRIHHWANLLTQQDCEEMAFISAPAQPKLTKTGGSVYVFKRIKGFKTKFTTNSQIAEIELQQLSLIATVKSILGKSHG